MKNFVIDNFKHMLHGGDYNPDQWLDTPEILNEDMRLMKLAGCNEMTVGIFAWSALEPEEGKFNFDWLDKVLNDVYQNGGRIILATPSGARPAWMAKKYPEVLRVADNGVRNFYGQRHNHCFTSPIYREKVAIINQKLAQRYKDHPAVIAWHISNEFSGECHCPLCKKAFREWLKAKYKTLENLNHNWWTGFWAHTYSDWDEIDPPSYIGDTCVHGKNLDWKRFCTYQTADYIRHEADILRKITPNIPITTNLMWYFNGLDYREIQKEIDFISWDSYPRWRGNHNDIDVACDTAFAHDFMRSLKPNKPFLIMESTPSHVNWQPYNKLKRPGMHILSSLQAVAHGSDSVLYFQWRKGRGASEKFHGAVVDHLGNENTRVFKEVSLLGARLSKLDEIVGTLTESKVAILYDVQSQWALEDAQFLSNEDKKFIATLTSFYKPLWKRGINVDIISPEDDFKKYSLIINPMQYMVNEEFGEKIASFVENGGKYLATYTTAMVDQNDLCYLGGFPGAGLRKVFGIWNEELDTLYPDEENTVTYLDGNKYKAIDCCEIIHTETADVLAYYDSDFYKGLPAATKNTYGKGSAYYIAFRDDGSFADIIVDTLLKECGISNPLKCNLPKGVTVHSRTDGESDYLFIENYNLTPQTITTELEFTNAETDEKVKGEIKLSPYEALIVKKSK